MARLPCSYFFVGEGVSGMFYADQSAGQKNPQTEVFKIMQPTGIAFDLFNPAVKAFAVPYFQVFRLPWRDRWMLLTTRRSSGISEYNTMMESICNDVKRFKNGWQGWIQSCF